MPITVKGNIATFTGEDEKIMRRMSKKLGLTAQDCFTGMLWEAVMRKAREGVFNAKEGKKGKTKKAIRVV